jgi:hypothetical protein
MFGKYAKWTHKEVEEMNKSIRYLNQYLEYIEEHIEELEERLPRHEPPSSWYDDLDDWDDFPSIPLNRMKKQDPMDEIQRHIDERSKSGKPFKIMISFEDL